MSEQSKLEQEIDRRAHAFADLSVGINGKNDTEDQKRLYWFGVRHGYSNGFSDAAEMHQHLMAEKDKRIERLRDCLVKLKHLNNHKIEEEMWRIDAALQEDGK